MARDFADMYGQRDWHRPTCGNYCLTLRPRRLEPSHVAGGPSQRCWGQSRPNHRDDRGRGTDQGEADSRHRKIDVAETEKSVRSTTVSSFGTIKVGCLAAAAAGVQCQWRFGGLFPLAPAVDSVPATAICGVKLCALLVTASLALSMWECHPCQKRKWRGRFGGNELFGTSYSNIKQFLQIQWVDSGTVVIVKGMGAMCDGRNHDHEWIEILRNITPMALTCYELP
eukprot:3782751-Amphidinium_carterae.2